MCHGYDAVPEPDGHSEMRCPEAGCASVECHGWETLAGRYHQASDMSLNLWILMPVALVLGLWVVSRRLSKGERACGAPRVAFDIVLLALLFGGGEPGVDGRCPCTNILGWASSCSWLPMLWRAVKAWAAAAVGRSACSTGCCWSRSRSASYRELMVSGTLLPSLGLYATGYYFWDPLHALFRQGAARCPARPCCPARAGRRIWCSVEQLARENEQR